MSESTDSEEVISMSRDRESLSGGSGVNSPRHSRQNLPPNDGSSRSARLRGEQEGGDWTRLECFETLCPVDKAAGFVRGELSASVDRLRGSGSQGAVAVVASVLWLELRDCRMKLKLELKESSCEDRTAGLGLNLSSF